MTKKLVKSSRLVGETFMRKPKRKIRAGERISMSTTSSGIKWRPSEIRVASYNGRFYTNILDDDKEIKELYYSDHDNSGRVHSEHEMLLPLFNKHLVDKIGANASVVPAGMNDEASFFYVEYHGRPETQHSSTGKTKQVAKIVAEIASQYPYIIEPSIGDISGEGDYTTHLIIWRE
jgi:hypothetical protein